MVAPYNNLTVVPPMGMTGELLLPSLAICLACLLGVLALSRFCSFEGRRRLDLATYSLLSLVIIQGALVFWGAKP